MAIVVFVIDIEFYSEYLISFMVNFSTMVVVDHNL